MYGFAGLMQFCAFTNVEDVKKTKKNRTKIPLNPRVKFFPIILILSVVYLFFTNASYKFTKKIINLDYLTRKKDCELQKKICFNRALFYFKKLLPG